jgi:hypothetical protein
MIFPYWEELRGTEPRHLPLIPVTIFGSNDSVELLALVDSGAEHNVMPAGSAAELGIPLDNAELVTIVGAGEHETPGSLIEVSLRVGRRRWQAPVIFVDGPIRPVLGQAGFFAYFTVTFRYTKKEMSIRWTG